MDQDSATSSTEFEYSYLEPRQIRLLYLSSPEQPDQISYTCSTVLLDDKTLDFVALSYCWGTADPTHTILLNNCQFLIRKNLYAFLQQFPLLNDPRPLWIDAICINQIDVSERESQVGLMGDLYRNASLVTIWLGEAEESCQLAFQLIEYMNATFSSGEPFNEEKLLLDPFTTAYSPAWTALGRLMCLPWFSRVWVTQEIILAKSAIMIWGNEKIAWDAIVQFVDEVTLHQLQAYQYDDSDIPQTAERKRWGWNTILNCSKARTRLQQGIELPISTIMSWKNLATNPKDHIYGRLGFITNNNLEIKPDYSSSLDTADMYVEVSAKIMVFEKSLRMLSSAGVGYPRLLSELPSWTPDFQYQGYDNRDHRIFNAAAQTEAKVTLRDKNDLTISGYIVDTISEVSPAWAQHFNSSQVWDWYKGIENQFLQPDINYEEFWRTLCVDRPRLGDSDENADGMDTRFEAFRTSMRTRFDPSFVPEVVSISAGKEIQRKYRDFMFVIYNSMKNRCMCALENGRLGCVPPGSEIGDQVFLGFGGGSPLLVRKLETGRYSFIGICWVYGIMNGEALEMGYEEEEIVLV